MTPVQPSCTSPDQRPQDVPDNTTEVTVFANKDCLVELSVAGGQDMSFITQVNDGGKWETFHQVQQEKPCTRPCRHSLQVRGGR